MKNIILLSLVTFVLVAGCGKKEKEIPAVMPPDSVRVVLMMAVDSMTAERANKELTSQVMTIMKRSGVTPNAIIWIRLVADSLRRREEAAPWREYYFVPNVNQAVNQVRMLFLSASWFAATARVVYFAGPSQPRGEVKDSLTTLVDDRIVNDFWYNQIR